MATRGATLLALGLAGVLLAITGCTDTGRPEPRSQESDPTPSPTVNQAREDLLQALKRTQGAAFRYTVRGSLPEGQSVQASGAVDPKGRLFEAKVKTSGPKGKSDSHRIVVDKHSYLRTDGVSYWVHLDLDRVKKDSLYYFDMSDPTGLVEFTSVVGSVVREADGMYYEK